MLEVMMGWVFFQVFLAFGTGILIVWWTWPKAGKQKAAVKPPELPAAPNVPSPTDDAVN